MMKQQSPSVSEATWNAVTEKAKKFFSDNLVKVYVPIYQKHLTLDDLKKIVAFYESPAGKKLGAVTPAITMEGMTAGQQLGMELVTLIQRELMRTVINNCIIKFHIDEFYYFERF